MRIAALLLMLAAASAEAQIVNDCGKVRSCIAGGSGGCACTTVTGTTGTFSGAVTAASFAATGDVSGATGTFSGLVTAGSMTIGGVPFTTTGAMTLYVDSAGNDANACTSSGASACLTIAGALSKVPKFVRHAVSISVGAGNFAGAIVDGFVISTAGSLVITGTMANVTPTTGTATGTFTSGAAGSNFTVSWGTATDSGATWTTNDFRDTVPAWITITGGTGSGQIRKIASNTGTALTITGGWATAPGGTSTYALQAPATIITSNATFTPWDGSTALTAGLIVNTISGSQPNSTTAGFQKAGKVGIQNIKFTNASRAIRMIGPGSVTVRHTWCAVNNSCYNNSSNGLMAIDDTFAAPTSSGNFIQQGGTDPPSFVTQGNLMHSSNFGYQMALGSWISTADYFFGQTSAALLQLTGGNQIATFLGTKIDCNSAGGDGIKGNTSFFGASFTLISASSISNCANGVLATGGTFSALTASGTGNTVAIAASLGGRMNIRSDVTLTGTTDISVDGVTYTLAALRALTPKVASTPSWGTVVGEL